MRLLPLGLAELGVSFDVPTQKGSFPHEFVNEHNLSYVGVDPLDSTVKNWSLKEKSLEYLKADLDCLYEVLLKFEKFCRSKYLIAMTDYISLPSMTMGIFRSKFMKDDFKIPILRGRCEAKCRLAYRGGNAEVYTPHLVKGYVYDMTSQYPAAMKNDMPCGNPIHVVKPTLNDFFGFCHANVVAPKDLDKPFLQTVDGGKVVTPLGKFSG